MTLLCIQSWKPILRPHEGVIKNETYVPLSVLNQEEAKAYVLGHYGPSRVNQVLPGSYYEIYPNSFYNQKFFIELGDLENIEDEVPEEELLEA